MTHPTPRRITRTDVRSAVGTDARSTDSSGTRAAGTSAESTSAEGTSAQGTSAFCTRALNLEWTDGHAGPITLKRLRDACPCAGCKGETVLLEHYGPPPIDYDAPGRYELRSLEQIGSYAIRPVWGDGHHDGIYDWVRLRKLCECSVCAGNEGRGVE